jgi:hypothetical protein
MQPPLLAAHSHPLRGGRSWHGKLQSRTPPRGPHACASTLEEPSLIFENAESLYKEAEALRQAGFLARAAFLHQISMEECAKIDMLGGWATLSPLCTPLIRLNLFDSRFG